MKSFALAFALLFAAISVVPGVAEARRLGGGGGFGMQRSLPARPAAPQALPAKPATPAAQPAPAAAAATPAAAPRRSWLGPIAGLAAGLGIAALMSHLGLGAEFGNIIMLALLAVAGFALIRFLVRRFSPAGRSAGTGGLQFAGAESGNGATLRGDYGNPRPLSISASTAGSNAVQAQPGSAAVAARALDTSVPAGFDTAGFERIAKMIFIRMQAANDAGDLNDLRAFTTPEVFAASRLELQERGSTAQRTDVVRVDAEVLDVASDADRQIVSVRFHGLIREQIDGTAEPFDEVWHLVKPADGSREWAIAGIQAAPALADAA